MTVRSVPFLPSTAGISVPSEIVRLATASLVPSPGLTSTTDLAVAAHGTPNMTVDVAAGGVWIKGTSVSTQGSYYLYNDATLSVAIAAADPSNPRIDLIVAVIRDTAEDASGSTDARIIAVTGTPAGTPVAPSAPASSITLAQVAVGATVTTIVSGNITDKRGATHGDGFVVCTSTTRPTARTGLAIFETDTGAVSIYNGTAWVTLSTTGAALTGAWTTGNPTLNGWTPANGKYRLLGAKTLALRFSASYSGTPTLPAHNFLTSLPGGFTAASGAQAISGFATSGTDPTSTATLDVVGNGLFVTSVAANPTVTLSGVIEVQ